MSSSVVIYSTDDIRGKIVSKILSINGIKAHLFSTHFEVSEAIVRHSPDLVILDLKRSISSELNFLQTLSHKLREATIIALASASDVRV